MLNAARHLLPLLLGLTLLSGCQPKAQTENTRKLIDNARQSGVPTLVEFGATTSATPVLAGILSIIGSQGDARYGILLMFAYALGHGALLLAGSSIGFAQWLARSRLTARSARASSGSPACSC